MARTLPPLKDRTILITGCSSGIGLCVARGLNHLGYPVFATARTETAVATLNAEGITSFLLDYDDSHTIKSALDAILEITQGQLYALFNNGAFGQPGAVEDLSRETLRAQFETNVFGWHELIRLVLPIMRRQGYGRIIQNSSVLGFIALRYRGAYNASKYAIEGLTDTLRLELCGTDIHISLIEPGPIESRFRANALKKFQDNIIIDNSVHQDEYRRVLSRLSQQESNDPFTLPPEAVLKRVQRILTSQRPAPRYPVTTPTYLFAALKRILPVRLLDTLLRKVS